MPELTKISIGMAAVVVMLGMCSLKNAWRGRSLPVVAPKSIYGVFVDETSGRHLHLNASGSLGVMMIEPADGDYAWLGSVTLADGDFYLNANCNGDGCKGRTTCGSGFLGLGPERPCRWETKGVKCHGRRTAPTKEERSAALQYRLKCDAHDEVVGECWCHLSGVDAESEYEDNRVVRKKYSRWMTLRKTGQRNLWRGTYSDLERER